MGWRLCLRQRSLDTDPAELTRPQRWLWERLENGPVALEELYRDQSPKLPLERVQDRGLIILSRFTPSDASHVLGLQDSWSKKAAEIGARLWTRWWAISGHKSPDDPAAFAREVFDAAITATTRALLEAAVAEEAGTVLPTGAAAEAFLAGSLSGKEGDLFDIAINFKRPVVAVGAPAATYYPEVGRRLHTEAVVPDHAHVCNAVGAVAGGIAQRFDALITAPSDGLFRCHLAEGIADFEDLELATGHTQADVAQRARRAAEQIGAQDIAVQIDRHDEIVKGKDGSKLFIESRISALATGRPALANA